MRHVQSKDMPTRRSALLLAAAASQLAGQKGRSRWDGQLFILRSDAGTAPGPAILFEAVRLADHGRRPASNIQTGSPQGIAGHITSLGHEPEHYTMFYVDVEDVKAALDKATELGARLWSGRSRFQPVRLHGLRIRTGTRSG